CARRACRTVPAPPTPRPRRRTRRPARRRISGSRGARIPIAPMRRARRASSPTAFLLRGRWRDGWRVAVATDCGQHPRVDEAAAEDTGERLLHFGIGRLRVLIEKRLGGEDDAVEAEAALCRLLGDERPLDRVRALDRAEPFERRDLGAGGGAHRCHARTYGAAADDHRARAALPEAT